MDTIFAQCTAPGKSGVAIFRISGPKSLYIALLLCRRDHMKDRHTYYATIYSQENDIIDKVLMTYFASPKSFTGEDCVEINIHGSIAIAKLLTKELLAHDNVRLADPGEFTRRAFLNNKMDLTEVEGMIDLINAETSMQQRQAIAQMNGALANLYASWRKDLIKIMALIEAYIDFPEEDIPEEVVIQAEANVKNIRDSIKSHLNDNKRGEILRAGIKMIIFGPPNVGKSSLINYLMKREIAIVSDVAGTTRDVLEAHLDIGGFPIILKDTAGIRYNSSDLIENKGIEKALLAANEANIKIFMLDVLSLENLNSVDARLVDLIDENTLILVNKIDLKAPSANQFQERDIVAISLNGKINLQALLKHIETMAAKISAPTHIPAITQERYRINLAKAVDSLDKFSLSKDLVLSAEDIRFAVSKLEFITGKIEVDEILGEIFSNFCVGK
ncbi:MAG: tRNA uridine-5-carboxymethylaminomethyl(34) synthesis GTPase MnmE [Rickettsiaceae bacterium]|nr:tRNA uridine-5-carboxymethylaminomethyl(34) synthesis GTPase MnmE [Rickettsiaceae bacterium]